MEIFFIQQCSIMYFYSKKFRVLNVICSLFEFSSFFLQKFMVISIFTKEIENSMTNMRQAISSLKNKTKKFTHKYRWNGGYIIKDFQVYLHGYRLCPLEVREVNTNKMKPIKLSPRSFAKNDLGFKWTNRCILHFWKVIHQPLLSLDVLTQLRTISFKVLVNPLRTKLRFLAT